MPTDTPSNLESTYLRLRNDATVETLSVDETFWEKISSGKLGSFHHEYLVTAYRFDADWTTWEMHPSGDEIVCLISGAVRFVLETPQGEEITRLTQPGQFAFVPKGTWHTAKVDAPSHMFFITAGEGTQHRDV
jgi:oxalate decarboxylase/phosphoglucose isomerase-like protein (cupin superfamily)